MVLTLILILFTGVSAVESILALDRLRQEVAVKELLAQKGKLTGESTRDKTEELFSAELCSKTVFESKVFCSSPLRAALAN